MDYDESLDRAMDAVSGVVDEDRRLRVPDPTAQADGAFTRLTNLREIADALARDPEHIHRFIQRDLGTSGQLGSDKEVARYSGEFSAADFDGSIGSYIEAFVTCSECGLPDTRLTVEDRTQMLRCEACGAFRPVSKRSTRPAQQQAAPSLEEGETYTVKITGTGRKGDGVANKDDYTIFVPGTQEGDVAEIYIESIRGKLAFARQVE